MKAVIFNCTLKSSPDQSNTEALAKKAAEEFESLNISTKIVRPVDYLIAHGTQTVMGHGDKWPELLEKIKSCQIFVFATPVWMGHISSVAQQVIERLDAIFYDSGLQNPDNGQYMTYNKVGAALVTGNEDGAHACIARLVWSMAELGFTIPPNSNAYWVGKAGSGPSYIEAGGERYLYTNKNYRIMCHNSAYLARLLSENPIPTNLSELSDQAKQESGTK